MAAEHPSTQRWLRTSLSFVQCSTVSQMRLSNLNLTCAAQLLGLLLHLVKSYQVAPVISAKKHRYVNPSIPEATSLRYSVPDTPIFSSPPNSALFWVSGKSAHRDRLGPQNVSISAQLRIGFKTGLPAHLALQHREKNCVRHLGHELIQDVYELRHALHLQANR